MYYTCVVIVVEEEVVEVIEEVGIDVVATIGEVGLNLDIMLGR